MKKVTKTFAAWAVAFAAMASPPVEAKVLLTDSFDYTAGNLAGQGSWAAYTNNTAIPVQVSSAAGLTFAGYQDEASGKTIKLNENLVNNGQRVCMPFAEPVTDGSSVFYSFLVRVNGFAVSSDAVGTPKSILLGALSTNTAGAISTGPYAVIDLVAPKAGGDYGIATASSTSTPTHIADGTFGRTMLIVVETPSLSSVGPWKVWINPTSEQTEPAYTSTANAGGTSRGLHGIGTYSGYNKYISSDVDVDCLRAATTWSELFTQNQGGGGDDPVIPGDSPKVTTSISSLEFAPLLQGQSAQQAFTLSAENLTGALSLSSTSSHFAVSPSVISKDDAEAGGAVVTVTFKPTAGGSLSGDIQITTDGMDTPAKVAVSGVAQAVTVPMSYAMASNNLYDGIYNDYEYLSLESAQAVVTYVDEPGKRFFIQDLSGALEVKYDYFDGACPVARGQKVRRFYAMVEAGVLQLAMDIDPSAISQGTDRSAAEVTLAELQRDPESYWNKVIVVKDLQFASAGSTFAAGSTQASSGDKNINVRPFNGTDIVGTAIPAVATVTGIAVAKNGTTIWPRSLADLDIPAADDPALEVEVQNLAADIAAFPIGQEATVAKFIVKADNLPSETTIYIGGTNRNQFALSTYSVPAGSGEYEVELIYAPTAIGTHRATVAFDAVPTVLSQSYNLTFKAYDPANKPTITAPTAVRAFEAAPGQTDTETITVVTSGLIDYTGGSAVLSDQSTPGAFVLSSTSLPYNSQQQYTITFKPAVAGDYSATLTLSATMAEPVVIALSGTSKGTVVDPDREGTDLVLDDSAPLKQLIERFDGVTRNKPLQLDGWCNASVQGNRAWWGYVFNNRDTDGDNYGESCAKVTGYVWQGTADTPSEMVLVTPALDFANGNSKIATFRVMGQNLPSEGVSDILEVLYIDLLDGADAPYIQSLDGLNIPATADAADNWVDYVIDLEDLDLADAFFLGFRLNTKLGANSAHVYYVDDVTWGRTDVPQVKAPGVAGLELTAVLGQSAESHTFDIVGKNLGGSITAKVTGANASKFAASTTTLPAEGGPISVKFSPEDEGDHLAYLELSADGAPTLTIPMVGHTTTVGIDSIDAEAQPDTVTVITLQGVVLMSEAPASAIETLAPGFYIINGKVTRIK